MQGIIIASILSSLLGATLGRIKYLDGLADDDNDSFMLEYCYGCSGEGCGQCEVEEDEPLLSDECTISEEGAYKLKHNNLQKQNKCNCPPLKVCKKLKPIPRRDYELNTEIVMLNGEKIVRCVIFDKFDENYIGIYYLDAYANIIELKKGEEVTSF